MLTMIFMKWILVFYLMFMGSLSFILNCKHLLSILLSLEFIVLVLFFTLFMFLTFFEFELYYSSVFLIFSVCEGALGIGILVSLIRTHGNDFFSSFFIVQC